jgi:hypothetical protein
MPLSSHVVTCDCIERLHRAIASSDCIVRLHRAILSCGSRTAERSVLQLVEPDGAARRAGGEVSGTVRLYPAGNRFEILIDRAAQSEDSDRAARTLRLYRFYIAGDKDIERHRCKRCPVPLAIGGPDRECPVAGLRYDFQLLCERSALRVRNECVVVV